MDSPFASLMDIDGSSYLEDHPPQQTQRVYEPYQARTDSVRAAYAHDATRRQAHAATADNLISSSPPSAGPFNRKRTFDTYDEDGLKERMSAYDDKVTYVSNVRRQVHFTPPNRTSPPHRRASPTLRRPTPPRPHASRPNLVTVPAVQLRDMRARGEATQTQLEALAKFESVAPPEGDGLRRACSMVTSCIYTNATSLYQRFWGFIAGLFLQNQEQEIISVQISPSGNKRRAVSGSEAPAHTNFMQSSSPLTSPATYLVSQIPGSFPDIEMTDAPLDGAEVSNQLTTPPDSRPGSREGKEVQKHDSAMAASKKLSGLAGSSTKNVTPKKSSSQTVKDSPSTIETSPTNTDTTIATNSSPRVKPAARPLATQVHRASTTMSTNTSREEKSTARPSAAQAHGAPITSQEVHAKQARPQQQQPARVGRLPFTRHIPQNYTPSMIRQDLDKLIAKENAQDARAQSSQVSKESKRTYSGFDRQPGQSAKDWIEQRNNRLRGQTRLPLDARQYVAPTRRQLRAQQDAATRAEVQPSLKESILRNIQKDAQIDKLVEKVKQTINTPPSQKKLDRSANEHASAKKEDDQQEVAADASAKTQETAPVDELNLATLNKVPEIVIDEDQESAITEYSEQLQHLSINDAKWTAEEMATVGSFLGSDITFSSLGDFDMNELSDPDFSKYNEKQKIIRPLPEEWAKRVNDAMATKNRREVLATTTEGTSLSRHDFGCLLPQPSSADAPNGWLNDEIVNAWIAAITDEKNKQKDYNKSGNRVPLFVSYPSAWYTTYKSKGNDMSSISRWSRRKGIQGAKLLECEKVFFPINTGAHWQLLIISPKKREIEFLNSINSGRHDARSDGFFAIAREWLQMELKDAYVAGEWHDKFESVSARQRNSDDCGAFVCFNALISAKGKGNYDVLALPGYEMQPFGRRLMAAVLLNGGFTGDWML